MANRKWGVLAALAVAIALTFLIGAYNVNADAPEYLYVEGDENSPQAQRFLARDDVYYRHGFQDGFSVKVEGGAKREIKKLGFKVSDIAVYQPNGTPSDPTPYGIEQIYSDPDVDQTSGGKNITIGHLDTGIDTTHPDLARRVVGCKDATSSLSLKNKKNNTCLDWDGHGTHTAGSAVADGGRSKTGIWGVAPDADLYSILVCTNAGCFADDIAAAIDYLGSNKLVDIITMSIGGPTADSRIAAAIDRHKDSILFVASAGNVGPGAGGIEYPAWDPNVIAVAAINSSEAVTNFSSRGVDDRDDSVISIGEIEFAAAGSLVESTYPTYFNDAEGYAYFSGTSMAAPHVAGLAAKLWQGDPNSTRMFLRTVVTDVTDGILATTGYDVASGYGLPHVGAVEPPAVLNMSHVSGVNGAAKSVKRDNWQSTVTLSVHDSYHEPIHRAKVEATWTTSEGAETVVACKAARDGTCKFKSPRFSKDTASVTFEVKGVIYDSLIYSADDSHDPDDATMVITRP